ncbi:MAG: hypothetical protein AB1512_13175 [Thermodesulfobacteriota bacterium]
MDYSSLKVGDTDPNIGKKIQQIILATESFIVYIDEDDVIQWAGDNELGKDFGHIANQVSYWEMTCNSVFSKSDAYDYKCLLAEGYARMFNEESQESAQNIIDLTSKRIVRHGKEVLRQRYLLYSLTSTAIVAFLLVLAILLRDFARSILTVSVFEILLTALFGGIGAFVSTITRAKNYSPEVSVGRQIHQIDGILRIVYGVIAGGIIGIGIKSNIAFGLVNAIQQNNIFVMTFLGAIAGASEMALPSIIKQMEATVSPADQAAN